MKKIKKASVIIIVLFIAGFSSCMLGCQKSSGDTENTHSSDSLRTKVEVLSIMQRVAEWQIANQSKVTYHDLDWTNATLYTGMFEFSRISGDNKYKQWLLNIGKKYQWQPFFQMFLADDIAVSQMYLDMYRVERDKRLFDPTWARTEWIVNHPSTSTLMIDYTNYLTLERWSWCDALFMAPPVYAQMYSITKDAKYIEFMDKEYKTTYDLLYDKTESLFFRDYRFISKREANGKKVFWGRGNGWVIGGLVKILKELPDNSQYKEFYKTLFVQMCAKIATLQDKDGYWHPSLLDPASYPSPETSGSGFFVYALAYGVNTGLLNKEQYLPIVLKGWTALENAVSDNGKLGWVQPVGQDPKTTTKDMTDVYGVGAFLLAGSEVYKLSR